MRKRSTLSLAPVLLLLLVTVTGCLHKTDALGAKLAISPWERVMTHNAMFSQLNNDAIKGTVGVAQSGIITDPQARPILEWEGQVAKDHEMVTAILAKGPDVAANDPALRGFFEQVRTSGMALVTSGGIGVKNPRTQQSLSQDIQAIVNIAEAVLSDIEAVKAARTQTGGTQ